MRFSTRVIRSSKQIKSRNGKVSQDKSGVVYVYATIDGKKTQVKTRFHLNYADKFSGKDQISFATEDTWINNPLSDLIGFLKERHNKAIKNKEIITSKSLKKWVLEEEAIETTKTARLIYNITPKWIEKYENESTKSSYNNFLSAFKKFDKECHSEENEKIIKEAKKKGEEPALNGFRYIDLTEEVLEDYKDWLLDGRFSGTTPNKRFAGLKTLISLAIKNKEVICEDYKRVENPPKGETPTIVATEEDLVKIKEVEDLPPYLENVRKWWMLSCTTGMRVSDLLIRKQKDFEWIVDDGFYCIPYRQKKTGSTVAPPICDQWVVDNVVKADVFPHKISYANYNKYLKKLFKKAGIDYLIEGNARTGEGNKREIKMVPKYQMMSSHAGRRTFATISYDKNISTNLIMQMTGHKREADFFLYINRQPKNIHASSAFFKAMTR